MYTIRSFVSLHENMLTSDVWSRVYSTSGTRDFYSMYGRVYASVASQWSLSVVDSLRNTSWNVHFGTLILLLSETGSTSPGLYM